MDHFQYNGDEYFAEDVPLSAIAEQVGTPCYVYSRATLERHWRAFDDAFDDYPHTICYAVKANSNLAVLNVLARLGSGFDIVSGGELERVLRAGGNPEKVVFSGVGKSAQEIDRAIDVGIRCFNVESTAELERINYLAGLKKKRVHVALRINPDVDAQTHPYISTGLKENKFGIPVEEAFATYQQLQNYENLIVSGVAFHIGSQLTSMEPLQHAFEKLLVFVARLSGEGIELDHIDLGGGLGVRYKDETPPLPADYTKALIGCLKAHNCTLPVMIEPGRVIAANAGVFLTQIEYLKYSEDRNFAVVDGAMNDLIRPALYQAWQEIIEVVKKPDLVPAEFDVVGPICESADFLGKERTLAVQSGDLLAVRSAGAYGAVMSSNYNTRPQTAEVMVDGDEFHLVKTRQDIDAILAGESVLQN
ncbi:MAG: diaminopimelate decarboxylase [Parasphingorhabdus sp.]